MCVCAYLPSNNLFMSFRTIYVSNIIGKRRRVTMNYIELLGFNANKNKSEHSEHVCASMYPIVFICVYIVLMCY